MKRHSNSSYFKIFVNLLLLFVIAKSISTAALWFLPKKSPDTTQYRSLQMPYVHGSFHLMISADEKSKKGFKTNKVASALNINTLSLEGLFGNSHYGYIIIAPKTKPQETMILAVSQSYKGYRLKGIYTTYALFVKNNQEYKLYMDQPAFTDTLLKENDSDEARYETVVARGQIDAYVKNPSAIWRDIGIQEVGKNGNFKGFKVTKLNANSPFAKLGLHVGDMIVEANNIKLKSYNDVMQIYQKLDQLQRLQLIINRGNIQKEIIYEIN